MCIKQVVRKYVLYLTYLFILLKDDLEGARHLPTLSMSSNIKNPKLFPVLCFDGLVLPAASNQHCQSLPERFPWLLLEYPEEVLTMTGESLT